MITMQGTSSGYFGDLGIDWSAAWDTAVGAAKGIAKNLPGAVVTAAEGTVTDQLTPIAQRAAEAKTQSVIKKGNVAMMMVGGGVLGALVAGGSWQRRAVGGTIIGVAATVVGWQIGWLADKA